MDTWVKLATCHVDMWVKWLELGVRDRRVKGSGFWNPNSAIVNILEIIWFILFFNFFSIHVFHIIQSIKW